MLIVMFLSAFVSRRVACLAAAVLLLMGLVAAGLLASRGRVELQHAGHPLSFWLQQQVPSGANPLLPMALSDEGADAVRQIGTNCLPMLLHWISYPEQTVRGRMFLWLKGKRVAPAVWEFAYPRSYRPDFAIHGIGALGPEARGAIPALVKMLGKKQDAPWAVFGLCALGPEGTSALRAALERIDDGSARGNVMLHLQYGIWPDRQADVAPVLAERLGGDPSAGARTSAARVLRTFTSSAGLACRPSRAHCMTAMPRSGGPQQKAWRISERKPYPPSQPWKRR